MILSLDLGVNLSADGPTADQQSQLQKLMEALKQIETQQKELQAAIKSAKADREAMFDKERDFFNPSAKEPPAPNMEVWDISYIHLACAVVCCHRSKCNCV